jgi:hypothetical protein
MQDFFSDLPLMIGAISIVFLLLWWGVDRWLFGDSKANKLGRTLPGNITNPEPGSDALSGFAASSGLKATTSRHSPSPQSSADEPDTVAYKPLGKTAHGESIPPLVRTDAGATASPTASARSAHTPALLQHRLPGTSIVDRNLKSRITGQVRGLSGQADQAKTADLAADSKSKDDKAGILDSQSSGTPSVDTDSPEGLLIIADQPNASQAQDPASTRADDTHGQTANTQAVAEVRRNRGAGFGSRNQPARTDRFAGQSTNGHTSMADSTLATDRSHADNSQDSGDRKQAASNAVTAAATLTGAVHGGDQSLEAATSNGSTTQSATLDTAQGNQTSSTDAQANDTSPTGANTGLLSETPIQSPDDAAKTRSGDKPAAAHPAKAGETVVPPSRSDVSADTSRTDNESNHKHDNDTASANKADATVGDNQTDASTQATEKTRDDGDQPVDSDSATNAEESADAVTTAGTAIGQLDETDAPDKRDTGDDSSSLSEPALAADTTLSSTHDQTNNGLANTAPLDATAARTFQPTTTGSLQVKTDQAEKDARSSSAAQQSSQSTDANTDEVDRLTDEVGADQATVAASGESGNPAVTADSDSTVSHPQTNGRQNSAEQRSGSGQANSGHSGPANHSASDETAIDQTAGAHAEVAAKALPVSSSDNTDVENTASSSDHEADADVPANLKTTTPSGELTDGSDGEATATHAQTSERQDEAEQGRASGQANTEQPDTKNQSQIASDETAIDAEFAANTPTVSKSGNTDADSTAVSSDHQADTDAQASLDTTGSSDALTEQSVDPSEHTASSHEAVSAATASGLSTNPVTEQNRKRWFNPFGSVFKSNKPASNPPESNTADSNQPTTEPTAPDQAGTASAQSSETTKDNERDDNVTALRDVSSGTSTTPSQRDPSSGDGETQTPASSDLSTNPAASLLNPNNDPSTDQADDQRAVATNDGESESPEQRYKTAAKQSVPSPTSEAQLRIPVAHVSTTDTSKPEGPDSEDLSDDTEVTAVLEIPIDDAQAESTQVLDSKDYMIARLQARIRELEANAEPNDRKVQLEAVEGRLKDSEARVASLQNKLLQAHQQAGAPSSAAREAEHNRPTLLSKVRLQSGQRS